MISKWSVWIWFSLPAFLWTEDLSNRIGALEMKQAKSRIEKHELAMLYDFQSDWEKAYGVYWNLYQMTREVSFLFDAALSATIMSKHKQASDGWKLYLHLSKTQGGEGKRWLDMGKYLWKCFSLDTLEDEALLVAMIRSVYLGKGYLLTKKLIDFYHLYSSEADRESFRFMYADAFYQARFYSQAASLFNHLHRHFHRDHYKLIEAKALYRMNFYTQTVECLFSIRDEEVKNGIFFYLLGDTYRHLGQTQEAWKCLTLGEQQSKTPREKSAMLRLRNDLKEEKK